MNNPNIISHNGDRIITKEDLIKLHNIDEELYEIIKFTANVWEQAQNKKDGSTDIIQLHQIKAEFKPIHELIDHRDRLIKLFQEHIPELPRKHKKDSGELLAVIPHFDIHIDRIEHNPKKYLKEIDDRTMRLFDALLKQKPDRLLYVNGGDYFNSDGNNRTTKGTEQHNNQPEIESFSQGLKHQIDLISNFASELPTDVLYVPGNHDCYSDDTEVLTNRGFIHHSDLRIEDLVATYDPSNLNIQYKEYANKVEYMYQGLMHHYKAKHTDILVTPNHKMLYNNRWHGDDSRIRQESANIPQKIVRVALAGGNENLEYDISDDTIRLVAWIMSDGTFRSHNYGREYSIYQSDKHMLVEELLERMGVGYYKKSRERTTEQICGKNIKRKKNMAHTFTLNLKHTDCDFLKLLDSLIEERLRVPKFIGKLSTRQFKVFLKQYILGDGTDKGTDSRATIYGREPMLSGIQAICIQNNIVARLSTYRDCQYRLYIMFDNVLTGTYKKEEYYNGLVWCLSVGGGFFVTRRNGYIAIQGNSHKLQYLSDAVDIFFSKTDDVTIDNSHDPRKYYEWGQTQLGFGHGDKVRDKDILSVFSTESKLRKNNVYMKGHIHHRLTQLFGNLIVETFGTPAYPSDYEKKLGYTGRGNVVGQLYDKKSGKYAEFQK